MPRLLLIDNYDSFTYNLAQFLGELGAEVTVVRNDAITVEAIAELAPDGLVLSPGPGHPEAAGVTMDVLAKLAGKIPVLGVCLGHQALAHAFGAAVVRAGRVMHGKTSPVHHDGQGLFAGMPSPFTAGRYHSLIVDKASLPEALLVTAETAEGEVMGLAHRTLPLYGLQFHPESVLTEDGKRLLANFLESLVPQDAVAHAS
ncbi:MAG: anthranilate synthase component II [Candidatus Sericytochromatia bacterium]